MSTPRLLLIDDSGGPREYELARSGEFDILTVARGNDGVALAASALPDAIVLDLVTCGLDGWATCARIKLNPATAGIPIILLTATNEPDLSDRAQAAGAVAVLLTPCAADTLRDTVRVAIHSTMRTTPGERAPAPEPAPDDEGRVWETLIDRTKWTATLRRDDPSGSWKAQINRAGQIAAKRRFETREEASVWVEAERRALLASGTPKS
jgi:CheY-like chemotaxis protein